MHRTRTAATTGACVLALLITSCSAGEATSEAEEPVEAHWSYEGVSGPAEWAQLDQVYETCGSGTEQSPVDLPSTAAPGGADAVLTGRPSEGAVEDNGHTVQLTDEGDAGEVVVEGQEYELVQMHVHTPSEHTIDGEAADVEFHFVHESEDGDRLVIAVLGEEGARSEAYAGFALSSVGQSDTAALDLHAMLPPSLEHIGYDGSLTTPPCTEGVEWVVMTTPVELSAQQLAGLNVAHPGNTRPAQPLGDREVLRATATWDAVEGG